MQSTTHTYREIMAQGDSLQRTLPILEASTLPTFLTERGRVPVFTGCGTSYHLAVYAAGVTRALAGVPAIAVPASELWLLPELHYLKQERYALVAISRSGTTTETVRAVEVARRWDVPVLAVTCAGGSPMSDAAVSSIRMPHVTEASVVMTQSFSNLLFALQWVAAGIAGATGVDATAYVNGLRRLPAAVAGCLGRLDKAAASVTARGFKHYVFLGQGPLYGVALEAMLKMKEMTQVPAEAYSTLEFRHGPKSTVTTGSLVVLTSCNRNLSPDLSLASEMPQLGGEALILAPESGVHAPPERVEAIALPDGFADWQYGSLAIPFFQLLGYHQTRVMGLNPDSPRHLTQVVDLGGESR